MTHTIDAEIPQESLPPQVRSLPFTNPSKERYGSLRCGGRKGSALRSDELRELQNSSLRP